MRKLSFLAVTAAAMFLVMTCPRVFAADAEFDAFWTKFKTALQKNDKTAIVSLTKFPYLLGGNQLNKQKFLAQYNDMFSAKTRKCMVKQKPLHDKDSYMVFCGEEIFVFAKENGKWLFTEVGAND
jgi:hypothetical protein